MELYIERGIFHKGLQAVQGVVETRSTAMPILQNILVQAEGEGISISATDLEVGFRAFYPARIKTPGAVTLSARRLHEILRELPEGEVHLKAEEGNWVGLECLRSRFRFPGLPPEDFPQLPDSEPAETGTLDKGLLEEMIRKTMFAISTDETRYTYNGVYMETEEGVLRFVATDGHRLALMEKPCEGYKGKLGVIIHKKALTELLKVLAEGEEPVRLRLLENHAVFEQGEIFLSARLIQGQFPNYRQVIPTQNDKKIVAPREDLVRALRRVSLLSGESRMVKFSFTSGSLTLSTDSTDLGEAQEALDVDYDGEEIAIGFNARYCLDVLNTMEEPQVRIELKDPLSPGIVRPIEEQGYIYVAMPMRV